jgi:murein DD-endopeptidase MepM/ murein hydrolase activator NlpD
MSDDYDISVPQKKRSITEKYRLAVIDEEDLKEVRSFRVSLLNIYILTSSIMVLLSIIIISVIFFTPVRRLVPGYADINENLEFREMRKKMDEIEATLVAQEAYNESLQKILQGNISGEFELDQNADLLEAVKNMKKTGAILPEDIDDKQSTKILGSLFFVPPVSGHISAKYLDADDHYGVDILAASNTPIKAVMDGIVTFADWTMESGNTISVQHPNNIISVYKHNSALLKKPGERISAGEALAIIGNTGTLSDGPHLHFELWYDGYPVDPEKYINF